MGMFDFLTAPVAGLAGDIGGMLFGSSEADKNRGWQENLSNTAIRRRVKDMKAAGINPLLAAQGIGASTPGGGIPTPTNVSSGLTSGLSQNIQRKSMQAQVAKQQAETESARVTASLDKKMLDYLDEHPDIQQSVIQMMLLNRLGGQIPGWIGGIAGMLSTIHQKTTPGLNKQMTNATRDMIKKEKIRRDKSWLTDKQLMELVK